MLLVPESEASEAIFPTLKVDLCARRWQHRSVASGSMGVRW